MWFRLKVLATKVVSNKPANASVTADGLATPQGSIANLVHRLACFIAILNTTAGKIADGKNGDVPSNQYHADAGDIKLITSFDVDAYQFLKAWPRITNSGLVIDFFSRVGVLGN